EPRGHPRHGAADGARRRRAARRAADPRPDVRGRAAVPRGRRHRGAARRAVGRHPHHEGTGADGGDAMKDKLMDFDRALELFEPVMGFAVHVELGTRTKMFSAAPNPAHPDFHEVEPNTLIDPLSLGLPGSLPVVNELAVRYSISLGLALGCEIAPSSRFARKNYFYPDIAKNYQISQYDEPTAFEGAVEVELADVTRFEVPIERAQMEED